MLVFLLSAMKAAVQTERSKGKMTRDIEKVLLSQEQIAEKVTEIGAQISRDYAGKNPMIVSVLKGSFIFMADLVRAVTIPCTVDFM